ncbi:LPD38 domain-containing protein [Aurantimonas sp. A3-2-R12]|uniref:LPD38 domain-containing protein n=1 Tax=Aurantimonas sp. A3-2-R12 TaxID=3114362 RepID=UPI002E176E73|nr:LPD38 domain-containing protein [Aurantimonas sp. A3-2-R12]
MGLFDHRLPADGGMAIKGSRPSTTGAGLFDHRIPALEAKTAEEPVASSLKRDEEPATFGDAVGRGVDQMQGMLYGGVEAIGEATGLEGVEAFGQEGRERNKDEAAQYPARQDFLGIRGAGDLGQWAKETVGEQLPIFAPSIGGAAAGAAVGSVVPGVGTVAGALVGGFLPSFLMGTGEVQGAIKDKDASVDAPGYALGGGAAIGVLDTILPGKIGTRVARQFGFDAAEVVAREVLTRRVVKEVGKGALTEGLTEGLQEIIGEAAAAQATGQKIDENWWKQAIEAGAAGALFGGTISGATAVPDPARTPRTSSDTLPDGASPAADFLGEETVVPVPVDRERAASPRLTEDDRASPIPNDLIDDGKSIFDGSRRMRAEPGLPATEDALLPSDFDREIAAAAEDAAGQRQPSATPEQRATLRLAGDLDSTIDEMSPGELDAETRAASDAGIAPTPRNVLAASSYGADAPALSGAVQPDAAAADAAPLLPAEPDSEIAGARPAPADDFGATFDADIQTAAESATFNPRSTSIAPSTIRSGDGSRTAPVAIGQTGDLGGGTIDGDWTSFRPESGTLNVPRSSMPQIKAENRGAMVNFLNARGIAHREESVPSASLKPTQAEFSAAKVEKAKDFTGGDRAILVSSDGYVLDGHHQWLARREAGEDVRVIRLDAPIRDLMAAVAEFPSATNDAPASDVDLKVTPPARPSKLKALHQRALAKKPVIKMLRDAGGVDPSSPLAGNLRAMDINARTAPGLFRKGGIGAADNFVRDEHPLFENAPDDGNGYIPEEAIIEALRREMGGDPIRTMDEFQRALASHQKDPDAFDDTPELVQTARAFIERGLTPEDAIVTAAENLADDLDQLTEGSSTDAEDRIPFFDDATEADGEGVRRDQPRAQEEGGRGRTGAESGPRARIGTDGGERTPASRPADAQPVEAGADGKSQLVIPGAERVPDRDMAQRGADSRLRPNADQRPMDDGLFGDSSRQTDLVDMAKPEQKPAKKKAEQRQATTGQEMLSTRPDGEPDGVDAEPRPLLTEAEQKAVVDIVRRVSGLSNVEFHEAIEVPSTAKAFKAWGREGKDGKFIAIGGYYHPMKDVIAIALNSGGDGRRLAYHESFHRVQAMFLTDQEKALLAAETENLRAIVAATEGREEQAGRMSQSEIEAEAFAIYAERMDAGGKAPLRIKGRIRAAWDRIRDMAKRVRNYLNGRGYQTFEDVFDVARSGQMKARNPDGTFKKADPSFSVAGDTRGEAFKRWFGDSKVVDADGKPLVVYHGSKWGDPDDSDFAFETGHTGADEIGSVGFYFTDDRQAAISYAQGGEPAAVYLRAENLLDLRDAEAKNAVKAAIKQGGSYGIRSDNMSTDTTIDNIENDVGADAETFFDWANEVSGGEANYLINAIAKWAANQGHDGMVFSDGNRGEIADSYAVFEPNQIKSATGNNGTFDPNDDRIQFSVRERDPNASFQSPADSAAVQRFISRNISARFAAALPSETSVVRKLQDRFIDMKRMQATIKRAGGNVSEPYDVYMAESLYYGRAGDKLTKLRQKVIEPLVDDMKARGIKADALDKYLYARHAPERNRELRKINPGIADPSGMSDAEAARIIAAAKPKQADYDALATRYDEIIRQTRAELLNAGLISQEMHDAWEGQYRFYAPLRGFEEDPDTEDGPSTGTGFSVRGPEAQRALGRDSKADSPLLYAIGQAEQAIIRAEKNRVGKTLLRLAQQSPNKEVWEIDKREPIRSVNKATGKVEVSYAPPGFKNADNVVVVKVGGKAHFVTIHHKGLARNFQMLGAENLGIVLRGLGWITRRLSMLNTSLNPEFVVSNFFRDLQTALVHMSEQEQKGLQKDVVKDLRKAIVGTYGGLKGKNATEWQKWFDEFSESGGKISFFNFDDIESQRRAIEGAINRGKVMEAFQGAADWIDVVNGSIENGVRLATYKNLRERGYTKGRAASVARELTVNFNRKGEWGAAMNALYMFSNAAVQGNVRVAQSLWRSKWSRRAAFGMAAVAFSVDWYNWLVAGDDEDDDMNYWDKVPAWEKERNLMFAVPGRPGEFAKIPLPYGYNVFYVMGQQIGAVSRNVTTDAQGASVLGAAATIAASIGNAFSPIGIGPNLGQVAAPTIADPFLQMYQNQNWTGGPIRPKKFDELEPDAYQHFKGVALWAPPLAKFMNEWTGGNEFKSGGVDPSPEDLEHMFDFATGGAGAFFFDRVPTFAGELASGKGVSADKIPFFRRLYGKVQDYVDTSVYYDLRDRAVIMKGQMEGFAEAALEAELNEARAEDPVMAEVWPDFVAAEKQLRKLRKLERAIFADENTTSEEQKIELEEARTMMNETMAEARRAYEVERRRQSE